MRRVGCFIFVAILACSTWANAQDARLELENKLEAQFVPTKITADRTDIVTAGSILLLHKDGLLMFSIDTKVPPTVSYKDGKLSMGLGAIMATDFALGQAQPGSNHSTVPQRKFVAGEKIWYVSSSVKDDGVLFMVYSDVYQDVRYYGLLKFPFAKKVIPPADELLKTIAEVRYGRARRQCGREFAATFTGTASASVRSQAYPGPASACRFNAPAAVSGFVRSAPNNRLGPDEGPGFGNLRATAEDSQSRLEGNRLLPRHESHLRQWQGHRC